MTDKPQLRLYNTLTRQKEVFKPLNEKAVRMYVCGPTVYDFAHIGNARPVIVFDVLFRLLRHIYGPEHVYYARNITDVDDKINARAVRDYPGLPLNDAIRKVTETTANQFQKDVKALGNMMPEDVNLPGRPEYFTQPRATDHIGEMIRITQRLIDRGYAYVAAGNEGREVLFSIAKMPRYGQLSNRKLDEQRSGARVAVEAHKRDAGDFVLWKESTADQPGWDADFTENGVTTRIFGRPGWHIECSAMSMTKLLEPFGGGLSCDDPAKNAFDIHGGGIDLVFPHHENEIAQSCCAFGADRMASIWMHNGFLQIEGAKMSKSEGNFFTIDELLNTTKFGGRKWPGEVLRLAMLKTHYRQPIDFTVKALEEADETIKRWNRLYSVWVDGNLNGSIDSVPLARYFSLKPSSQSTGALLDDLNSPRAISDLQQLARQAERGELEAIEMLVAGCEALGIGLDASQDSQTGLVSKDVETLIDQRLAARRAKDFAASDRIRDELLAMGIQLKDGKDPVTGEPVTTWEVKR